MGDGVSSEVALGRWRIVGKETLGPRRMGGGWGPWRVDHHGPGDGGWGWQGRQCEGPAEGRLLSPQPRPRRSSRPSGATCASSSAAGTVPATLSRWLPPPCTAWTVGTEPCSGSGQATTRSMLASQVRQGHPKAGVSCRGRMRWGTLESWARVRRQDTCPPGNTRVSQRTEPFTCCASPADVCQYH